MSLIDIWAGDKVLIYGDIRAGDDVRIFAHGGVENEGTIEAGGNITIRYPKSRRCR